MTPPTTRRRTSRMASPAPGRAAVIAAGALQLLQATTTHAAVLKTSRVATTAIRRSTPEDQVFTIQRIGTYSPDLPITPHDPNARCLSVGEYSTQYENIPISFEPCEAKTVLDGVATDANSLDDETKQLVDNLAKQEWSFTVSGQLLSQYYLRKMNERYCVRRIQCEVTSTVYDVGPCAEGLDEQSEPSYSAGSAAGAATSFTFVQPQASTNGNAAGTGTVVFEVSTPVTGHGDSDLKPIGRPLAALNMEPSCSSCGPYNVIQFCKTGAIQGRGVCSTMGKKASYVGWTRLRSHWLPPPDANPGVPLLDKIESFTQATRQDGLQPISTPVCGSKVSDGADTESFFYFMKSEQTASEKMFPGGAPAQTASFALTPEFPESKPLTMKTSVEAVPKKFEVQVET
ncbi:unnamed protein product [Amoebophrya sp. A120]|nr:unnamed protein product [Amoebophrya sp. A120]|eukprot:GSA120T00013303001.1